MSLSLEPRQRNSKMGVNVKSSLLEWRATRRAGSTVLFLITGIESQDSQLSDETHDFTIDFIFSTGTMRRTGTGKEKQPFSNRSKFETCIVSLPILPRYVPTDRSARVLPRILTVWARPLPPRAVSRLSGLARQTPALLVPKQRPCDVSGRLRSGSGTYASKCPHHQSTITNHYPKALEDPESSRGPLRLDLDLRPSNLEPYFRNPECKIPKAKFPRI